MPTAAPQRAFALEIVQKLRAANFEALWAGGCVRDELLGIAPKDYDVATSATPDQIRDLFGHRRTLPIGAAFGVVTVLGPRAAGQIEVATFRTDATYSDGRHPDSVTFTDAQHDAQRRDFTINGLFFDPVAEQVVDYVHGQEDLKAHLIRAIGNPRLRLREDKLRMLRAIRFAAAFNFAIDPATMHAIQEMAPEITTVSAERIGMEIRRMLLDVSRGRSLELLREARLLHHVLPEFAGLSTKEFNNTLHLLSSLDSPTLPLTLAALLSADYFTTALPASSHTYPSLAPRAPFWARQLCRRLRFTNKELDRTTWILEYLRRITDAPRVRWPLLQRILSHPGASELVALQVAISGSDDSAVVYCRERLAWPAERLNPPPLVDGADLIRHGLTPGPQFAALLEQIRDAQLEGEISSREQALALADRLRAGRDTLP